MKRLWMPLYIADYLRDTRKLTPAEHGAYLLLIMEYWTSGGLPDDDRQLARIIGMTAAEWKKSKPNVHAFFTEEWKHKRIDKELARTIEISNKRAEAAKQRGSKIPAIALQKDTHAGATPQLQLQTSSSEAKASAPSGAGLPSEASVFLFGKTVLGKGAGGQITKLRKMFYGDWGKIDSILQQAARKGDPAAWIAGVLKGSEFAEPTADEICPPEIYENVL